MSVKKIIVAEEREYTGYIGECYAEHCNRDAINIAVHHHHEGLECNIQRNDDNHCVMMFCDKHSRDMEKGKKVPLKPEIVNR